MKVQCYVRILDLVVCPKSHFAWELPKCRHNKTANFYHITSIGVFHFSTFELKLDMARESPPSAQVHEELNELKYLDRDPLPHIQLQCICEKGHRQQCPVSLHCILFC